MNHRSLLLLLLTLSACDGTAPSEDAFVPQPDAGPQLEPSTLFGPCVEDWQCPGEGAICRTAADGYPGGYCTVPCEDRTPCRARNAYHHCVQRAGETQTYCELRCLNGIDCGRDGYSCAGELPPSGGLCIAVCSSDEQCGSGTRCDPYTGECVEGEPATGAVTGEPCDEDADCRSGQCVQEINADGLPTGWIHGYCMSNCILPPGFNNNTFYMGDTLPQANCAGDAVCIPATQRQAVGDLGACYDQCASDDDCREGYGCLSDVPLGNGTVSSYTNGLCVPKACSATQPCPSGYQCVTLQGPQPRNVCAPR